MKWIGQHIWDFISRFRSDVYLEGTETGTIASGGNLGLDANNKIVKADTETGELTFNGDTTNGVLTYGGAAQIDVEPGLTYAGGVNKILYIGADDNVLTSFQRIGHSDGDGGDLRVLAGAASSGSSNNNQPGGDLSFYAGNGTGNAAASQIRFNGPQEGSSGDSAQDSNGIASMYNNSTSGKNFRLNAANDVSNDFFNIACGVNAATTITTTDASGGPDADLTFDIDGDIVLDSATGIIKTGSTTFVNNSGVVQVATQGTIDHDSLANYSADEHFTQANIVATGTIASGTWQGTAIASAYLDADTAHLSVNQTFTGIQKINTRRFNVTAGSSAGEYMGDVVYTGSTTGMTAGNCYYYTATGEWALTNAGATGTSTGLLAIALGAESDTHGMLLRGMVTTSAIAGTQDEGAIVHLRATNGILTTDQASSGQVNRIVGYCMENSNNRIYFDPDKSWVELA